jgi:eukaryotic-like serine/threonine-protein kinase
MTHITVPSVDDLDLGAATTQLESDNLTVGTVSYQYSATAGKNIVVSQNPSAGSVAHRTEKLGPPVDLVVSLGTPNPPQRAHGGLFTARCVVPSVRGASLKSAKTALTAAHCEIGEINYAFSRTFREGRVMSARPGAGRHLPDGARVALTVSKGKRQSRR